MEAGRDVVDDRFEGGDHLGRHTRDTGLEPVALAGLGRQLGAGDEQLGLETEQQLVEVRPRFRQGASEAERGDGLVDVAVRRRAGCVLSDSPAVEQPRSAVVTLARVHLPRRVGHAPKRRGLAQVRCRTMSVASQRPAPTPGAEAPETGRRPSLVRSFVREARPKQWVKNVLVFAAPGAAGGLTEPDQLGRTLIAFAAFCLAASGTYFLNDAMDAEADRQHPKKRHRPVAAGVGSPQNAQGAAGGRGWLPR